MKLLITILLTTSLLTPLMAGTDPRVNQKTDARTIESVQARTIKYDIKDVATIHCYVGFTTCIILPEGETILDFTIGDKDFWILEGVHNLAYVRPSKAHSETNVNLVCSSGMIYSFLLKEIHDRPDLKKDYKLFVTPKDLTLTSSPNPGTPKYVDSTLLKQSRQDTVSLRQQISDMAASRKQDIQTEIDRYTRNYPANLCVDYRYSRKKPFNITAIYHDDRFTYITCRASEKPILYEITDGHPHLISYQLEGDTYIIPKILEQGYLQIGKKKLTFKKGA